VIRSILFSRLGPKTALHAVMVTSTGASQTFKVAAADEAEDKRRKPRKRGKFRGEQSQYLI